MLAVGDKLPAMTLTGDDGAQLRTGDLLGKTVVLWFYPKDDTPG